MLMHNVFQEGFLVFELMYFMRKKYKKYIYATGYRQFTYATEYSDIKSVTKISRIGDKQSKINLVRL